MNKLRCYLCVLASVLSVTAALSLQVIDKETDPGGLPPGDNILWTDPGDVSSLDFQSGAGGEESQPQPPFRFVSEDVSGSIPKVDVIDDRGVAWNVKWGPEARASVFCTRLLWACGYFSDREYFLAQGRIEGVHGLKRARSRVSDDGSFKKARFQLRADSPKFLDKYSWTWTNNPFTGTRELQGLKIIVLLVSNWDTKDARDFVKTDNGKVMDSNLAIFEDNSSGQRRYLYADIDWGAALGRWGHTLSWSKWDCRGFAEQTRNFVKGVEDGKLKWGFSGKHRKDIADGISVSDVQWILQYLGKISDEQIRSGLAASGAKPDETNCYTRALRQRVEQLQQAARE